MLRPVAKPLSANVTGAISLSSMLRRFPDARFQEKTVYSWLVPFHLLETWRDNICLRYTKLARFTVSNRPSSWLSVDFYYISQNGVDDQFLKKLGIYITYMKMGSTTISFLLLPEGSRRIRFVTSIAGLFSPHLLWELR